MKYTLKSYGLAHRLSTKELFARAWKDVYGQEPNYSLLYEDVDRYRMYGAVPPYVQKFIDRQKMPVLSRFLNYTPYWTKA